MNCISVNFSHFGTWWWNFGGKLWNFLSGEIYPSFSPLLALKINFLVLANLLPTRIKPTYEHTHTYDFKMMHIWVKKIKDLFGACLKDYLILLRNIRFYQFLLFSFLFSIYFLNWSKALSICSPFIHCKIQLLVHCEEGFFSG